MRNRMQNPIIKTVEKINQPKTSSVNHKKKSIRQLENKY
jgi:hypothetical protein